MKRTTKLLFVLACLCMPLILHAQKRDDSKYLAGAVPEVDDIFHIMDKIVTFDRLIEEIRMEDKS